MMRLTTKLIAPTLVFASLAATKPAKAIGREDLKPGVDHPEANEDENEDAEPSAPQTGPQAPAPENPAVPPVKTNNAPTPAVPAKPGESAGAPTPVPAPVVRSATSKNLDRKLLLGASFGFADIKSNAGTWSTRGSADLMLGYDAWDWQAHNAHLFATYRYSPLAVSVRYRNESYRGIVEGHYVGGQFRMAAKRNYTVFGQVELGPQAVHIKATDSFTPTRSVKKSGFSAILGGGVEWELMEKTLIGPRVNVGFGRFTTLQAMINASFLF